MVESVSVSVAVEEWPLRVPFRISRGARTKATVVVCTVEGGGMQGHGECVPYARYGETVESVMDEIRSLPPVDLAACGTMELHQALLTMLPPGAARNAIDCALWDLNAKRGHRHVYTMVCEGPPRPLVTALTLSLDTPEAMADAARVVADRSLLKIKLGGDRDDIARMHAVVANAPNSRLIVDANESWTEDNLTEFLLEAARLHVALVEQPLPVGKDAILATIPHPVPICADESAHVTTDLDGLGGRYDVVNIKLDKTGGLTEALTMRAKARELGFGVMVGCMVGSSLAMAPAVLLAQDADYVDLDGPLLLAADRHPALHYYGSTVSPPQPSLWG